jgi:type II secretory pathway pseudopilin PulG
MFLGMAMRSEKRGFTLIEFAVIMSIAGLIMGAVAENYRAYSARQSQDTTYERVFEGTEILSYFQSMLGRYPCPADPTLAPENPNYGVEVCPAAGTPAVGACTASGGICRGEGQDTGIDADTDPDTVLTGMVPFKTIIDGFRDYIVANPAAATALEIRVSEAAVYDGWGRKFNYTVTESMTVKTTFKTGAGALIVKDETDTQATRSGVHFAVLSHGVNGAGGYTAGGIAIPCPATGLESENCNGDGTLISPILRSVGGGATGIDDIVVSKLMTEKEVWAKSPGCTGTATTCDIYSVNSGNIGISTTTPEEKLDIGIKDIRADRIRIDAICNQDGLDCYKPSLLGGDGMQCDEPTFDGTSYHVFVVTGIQNGQIVCEEQELTVSLPLNETCPANTYMVGFTITGDLVCQPFN